jgi:hypothetical protein
MLVQVSLQANTRALPFIRAEDVVKQTRFMMIKDRIRCLKQ